MEQSIRDTLGSARVRRGADTGLAVGLAVLALVDLALSSDATSWGGRGPLQVCLALGCTLPLAWRVRYPIATVVVITAAGGLLVAVAAPHQAPFEVFIGSVLASYSIGAHTAGRRRWLGLGLMFGVGLPFMVAAGSNGMSTGNALAPIAWLTGAWAVGAIIRGRRLRTAELELLTAELAQQRDLQAEAAVAVERGRIARELHDVVAHNVSMMVVQAGAADRVLEGDQPDVRRALAAIAGTGRETVDEMRLLLGVVRSDEGAGLSPQPGLGDLDQLVSNVRNAGLHVDLRVEGERSPLSPGVDLSAYRIVQEALTNVLKHAETATVEVTVRYANDAVQVEVCDDGRPREPPPAQLVAAVHTVYGSDALLAPASTRRLIEQHSPAPVEAPELDRLTGREREVLRLLARGLTNAEIARTLVVEPSTVKSHVARVLAKLGLRDRVQAVVFAYDHGVVRPGD